MKRLTNLFKRCLDIKNTATSMCPNPDCILVIGPAWVGDFIMAHSLFQVLKARAPDTAIDVVAPPWTAPLAARMPEVRKILVLPLDHRVLGLATRWRLGRGLRTQAYRQAIILPRSFKAALVPMVARVTRRTGYLGEIRWGMLNDIRPWTLGRTVDRFVALGLDLGDPLPDPLPYPRLTVDPDNAATILAKLGLNSPTSPVLALCPGAEYGPAKRWPAHYFAEVARQVIVSGWQVWLFGSSRDAAITAEVQQLTGNNVIDLAGRISLTEAIDLLALVTAVVTNDSGLMHVAAALDRPVVALFGSSHPGHTPPLSFRATILYRDPPCGPCFQRTCPQHHYQCLHEITPADVMAALNHGVETRHRS